MLTVWCNGQGWVMGLSSAKQSLPSPDKADELIKERLSSDLQVRESTGPPKPLHLSMG
jgi:hypothetical protein